MKAIIAIKRDGNGGDSLFFDKIQDCASYFEVPARKIRMCINEGIWISSPGDMDTKYYLDEDLKER